ncbi:flagellar hook-length control protein FliK [Mesorhizobium sp. AR10]|uniref:flagellar hook-length control protein FliK n=1 Tax=Mesorhizobium sp. AR10 TaxID=2865839 RepID=UPI00216073E9|nr:flagellar hook-length control protein FliK [Mesorhizobium sp. AR10]UVK40774.1 flagellar hook-length control protein FliK [Mesorhizobium sp. AR10]
MTTSVGQALPGFAPTRAPSTQNGKSEETSFDDMVRSAESPSGSESPQAKEAGLRDPRWPKRASASFGKGEPDAGQVASPKLPTGKTARDDADTGSDKTSVDAEETGQSAKAASLHDHLPLLIALHDMRHFSASAKSDGGNTVTDEQASDPALNGQPRSTEQPPSPSKKYRSASSADADALGALSRSERALAAAALSGQNQTRQAVEIEPVSKETVHQDDLASHLLKDQPAADIPAPEGKRSASAMKGLEAVQAAMRSESGKQASAGRIEIVTEQSFPAPSHNSMSQTTSAVIDAIASDGLRQAASTPSAASQTASAVAVPTHILKIELHPAELGMVTASLRLAGEQLSIELKPETHEAYRRLTTDSEAIVKSLRGLGFDVDKVTILQPSIAVPAPTRADAGSSLPMSTGRDQPSFQPGNSSGNNAGSGGQQPGRNHSNDAQEFGRPASPARDRAGDDMFI